jgi:cytochrome c peroxidase
MKKYIIVVGSLAAFIFAQAIAKEKNPMSKETLGELLFSDPILSKNHTISCASCHKPQYAFADTLALSMGVGRRKGSRNTPTAMNLSLATSFFWDGRAKTLEEQALAPIENPREMNLPVEEAVKRLNSNKRYTTYFKEVFKSEATKENLAIAVAAFERTLETSDSPFDNWKFSDDSTAVSAAVKRGFVVFNGKGKCIKCHFGADFTANEFRNIGLFNGKNLQDSGRFIISRQIEDIGRFKTPSLRNVAITAPYMHNGMFKSLDKVIEFYNNTKKIVPNSINKDSLLQQPLGLSVKEKNDLKAFLVSLTDKRFKK